MTSENSHSFDKKKFDAFMALYSQREGRRIERAKYEWRMSFALWALLIAATYYLHPRPPQLLLIFLLTATVALHLWFISEVRKRSRLDTETAFYYSDHAEQLLGLPNITVRRRPDYEDATRITFFNFFYALGKDFWWSGIQITITAALAWSCYFLMGTFDRASDWLSIG
jgi:hypothetical protein